MAVIGQIDDLAALPPEKSPPYEFYRNVGGLQSQSGRFKNILTLQNIEPLFLNDITSIITINIACPM
jgi:hypothetical protein